MVWSDEVRRKVPVKKTAQGVAVYHATLSIFKDGQLVKKVPGDKMETAVDFNDYLEKAQSGAISRCLMFAGFGTAFAVELDEGTDRLSDAPVDRRHTGSNGNTPASENSGPTEQQLASLKNLTKLLGKEVAPPQSYADAKELVTRLSAEYNATKKKTA